MPASRKDHLEALRKRRDWLLVRIARSDKDLTHDKREAAALTWALNLLDPVGEFLPATKG